MWFRHEPCIRRGFRHEPVLIGCRIHPETFVAAVRSVSRLAGGRVRCRTATRMRRRHATIPLRRRIFLGCEGESEQGYGALLSRIAEEHGLHLAPQILLLRPGGGDP